MLETLKSWVFSFVVLLFLGGLGYFAFISMESGSDHVKNEKISLLLDENESLKKEIEDLTTELAKYKPAEVVKEPEVIQEVPKVEEPKESAVYKHQTLINELNKLITDRVNMKLGSKGTRVGTVQKFLNIYNKTNIKVDNTYGESVKKAVSVFQKAEGLTADGNAGATTFQKMIEWLKKQG